MLPFRFRRIAALCALAFSLTIASAGQNGESFQSIVQSANAARDAGNTDEAIRDYRRAVAFRPDWAEGWWDLGTTQYETNQYADAVASLQKLVRLAPNSAAGWSILGLSEFETKDYGGALASLEKAQLLGGISDPDIAHVSAYHLALLLIRNGEFERGAALLHSTFGDSTSPQVKTALGLALLRIPLLPDEFDPTQDALIQEAGDAAASNNLAAFSALAQQHPQTPWVHYAYGLALASQEKIEEALAQQKIETEVSPTSPLPWIEISSIALRLKKTQDALSAAKRAVILDPNSSAAHKALAKALTASGETRQAALETSSAARLAHAPAQRDATMIARYSAGSPATRVGNPEAWSNAMQDYSAGRYQETIAALKSWVEENPADGTAWAVMGLAEFSLKDYDNARIHLQRGINLGLKGSPEAVQLATQRLALLLIRDGQFDAATSLLGPQAGKPPLAEQTRLALGLALLRIRSLPDDLGASDLGLAQSAGAIVELLLASRYADAFPEFQNLIAEHPATPWLHYAYGIALDSLSQYDEAKTQMQAELKLSPQSALPWIKIAAISVRQHLPAEALKAAQNAVAIAPDSAEAHYELGRAWLESGDAQKAVAELEKSNAIQPNTPEIHFVLAQAYAKANLPKKAAAERAVFMQLKTMANQKAQNSSQGESILDTNTQQHH